MDNSTGKIGEKFVEEILAKKGYKIKCRNFNTKYGEIDIVACDDKYIVFVEVKTRKQDSMVSPFEAVTPSKQRKIILTAQYYLLKNPVDLQPRFDVAGVVTKNKEVISLDYITNAFQES